MAKPFEPKCVVVIDHGWGPDDDVGISIGKFNRELREFHRKFKIPSRQALKNMRLNQKRVGAKVNTFSELRKYLAE